MNKLTYHGKVTGGKIELPGKKFREEVAQAFEGKPITVTVERRKKTRSPQQNAYYWGVVVPILRHAFQEWNGNLVITPDDVHDFLKDRFLPMLTDWEEKTIETPEGEKELRRTTTRLSTVQFMDYIALIQQWAAEYSLYVPDPDEWEFEGAAEIDVDNR